MLYICVDSLNSSATITAPYFRGKGKEQSMSMSDKDTGLTHSRVISVATISKQRSIHLTPKESQIVRLMVTGLRPKQIAWNLEASLHTVNTHLANIKQKFGCANSFQLGLALGATLPNLHANETSKELLTNYE